MPKYIYRFGKCEGCGEFKPLENGLCNECNAKDFNGLQDFLKNIFRKVDNDIKRD